VIITSEVQKTVVEITDTLCNKCGESLLVYGQTYGILDAHITGGYYSTHIDDGITYRFDLCEKCSLELIKSFKISALVSHDLFPKVNEQVEQEMEKSMEHLKDSVRESMDLIMGRLKAKGGFIKFGDDLEAKVKKTLEDLKDKIK
jgi:hypothetical protein